jgi:hypothetical protein
LSGGTLCVGEGLETVLSAATMGRWGTHTLRPAWAFGGGSGLMNLPLVPSVERLLVLEDYDASGLKVAETVEARWTAAGRTVVRLRSSVEGEDANDMVRRMLRERQGPIAADQGTSRHAMG